MGGKRAPMFGRAKHSKVANTLNREGGSGDADSGPGARWGFLASGSTMLHEPPHREGCQHGQRGDRNGYRTSFEERGPACRVGWHQRQA